MTVSGPRQPVASSRPMGKGKDLCGAPRWHCDGGAYAAKAAHMTYSQREWPHGLAKPSEGGGPHTRFPLFEHWEDRWSIRPSGGRRTRQSTPCAKSLRKPQGASGHFFGWLPQRRAKSYLEGRTENTKMSKQQKAKATGTRGWLLFTFGWERTCDGAPRPTA